MKKFIVIAVLVVITLVFIINRLGDLFSPEKIIIIEAGSFINKGGWVIDQQSIDQMGSSYLLAHGLGVPVADATTSIEIPVNGDYRVWARTRDWAAQWNVPGTPGKFQLLFNNQPLKTIFGTEGADWHWQDGGTIHLESGIVEIALRDLTGFAGRCDAIVLTRDLNFKPPNEKESLYQFRRENLGFSDDPEDAGEFDLVVVGGGMAGITTAISAARHGISVALIQNRPVLGGNNSSEVRVGLSGHIFQEPYTNLGKLVDEVGSVGHWTLWEAKRDPESERSKIILEIIENNPEKKIHNAGPKSNYGDDKKLEIIENEPNITLFLNTHVSGAEKEGDRITAVIGKSIISGKELKFRGRLFADCTGDGNLGYLAGADFRVGREARNETGELLAPEIEDNLVMGTSVQWFAIQEDQVSEFPECPWAVQFDEATCQKVTRGDWNWEFGIGRDQITDIELIRDYAFRVIYGNWDFIKNKSTDKQRFAYEKLSWVAAIGGKRESRRLLGDIILKEHDILDQVSYPDASFTTTWPIDLHYPIQSDQHHRMEPFLSIAPTIRIEPYPVPYRCLYSRNISNLFMAGRNISVSHVALGSVRVMRTIGMMGEVVGMAASICIENDALPRNVHENYLEDLKKLMLDGVPKTDGIW